MEFLNTFIDYIARTNLFNFVIFASIIIFLIKKINVTSLLEKEQVAVKDSIVESESAKFQSETKLSTIEDSIANIEDDIDAIINASEDNAELVGEKLVSSAQKTALIIKDNTEKSIENNRTILKNELIKRASLASIEVAKSHIINELKENDELHTKLINESIEALEIINEG